MRTLQLTHVVKSPVVVEKHNSIIACANTPRRLRIPGQLPGKPGKWYMSFIGYDGKGYQSFIAESQDLVHWDHMRLAMGYVIQEGGLFPHLTARDNAAIMARHLGWEPARVAARLDELISRLSPELRQGLSDALAVYARGDRVPLRPGRLVIVDLRDELVEKDEALGLFVVLPILGHASWHLYRRAVTHRD